MVKESSPQSKCSSDEIQHSFCQWGEAKMHYRFNIHYIRSFLLRQVIYTSLSSIFRFSSTESYYNMNFLYFSCLSDGLNEQVIGVLSFNSGGDDCNCDTSQNPAGLCLFSPSAIYSSVDRLDECEPLCTRYPLVFSVKQQWRTKACSVDAWKERYRHSRTQILDFIFSFTYNLNISIFFHHSLGLPPCNRRTLVWE